MFTATKETTNFSYTRLRITSQKNELNTAAHVLLNVVINVHTQLLIKMNGYFNCCKFYLKRYLSLRMATGYANRNVSTEN
jgi:hypothetical protein